MRVVLFLVYTPITQTLISALCKHALSIFKLKINSCVIFVKMTKVFLITLGTLMLTTFEKLQFFTDFCLICLIKKNHLYYFFGISHSYVRMCLVFRSFKDPFSPCQNDILYKYRPFSTTITFYYHQQLLTTSSLY